MLLFSVFFWLLAGVAFCTDRWRIPSFTVIVLLVIGLNFFPQEHVYSAIAAQNEVLQPLPTPGELLHARAFGGFNTTEPLIVVTATGGGIHAATWTASVLAALERRSGGEFHKHLLLISSVSGGSIAAMNFLREYQRADHGFSDSFRQRSTTAERCTSLQAVAWGLAYPDTLRAVMPFLFTLSPRLQEVDRGWALEQAFRRNLGSGDCYTLTGTVPPSDILPSGSISDDSLRLNALAAAVRVSKAFPAFAMNSTVVETGDRFLFSNYSVPANDFHIFADGQAAPPAADFLSVFGRLLCVPG